MPAKKKFDPSTDDENPIWTKTDIAKSKPASQLPADILAQFPRTKVGRPRAEITKTPVFKRFLKPSIKRFMLNFCNSLVMQRKSAERRY